MDFDNATQCLNCQAPLSSPYCGQCGQKKATQLSVKELYYTAKRGLLDFESPFLITLWRLTAFPGQVCKEYIEGKRATYFNPARYAFWLLTATVIICSYFDTPLISPDMFSAKNEEPQLSEMTSNIFSFMQNSVLYLTFGYGLLNAICIKMLFNKHGYKLAELYILGLLPMVNVMLVAMILVISGWYNSIPGQAIYSSTYLLFTTYAITQFYGKPLFKNAIKAFCSIVLSYIIFVLLIAILVFIYGMVMGYFAHQ